MTEHRPHAQRHQNRTPNQTPAASPGTRLAGQPVQERLIDSFLCQPDAVEYTLLVEPRRRARHNVGWRIDYQIVSPTLRARLKTCAITPSPRFSDHAPYAVDYIDELPSPTRASRR